MIKTIKKIIAGLLSISVVIFATLSILSIWEVFSKDIATKSLSTLGVILFSSLIALVIIRLIEEKKEKNK